MKKTILLVLILVLTLGLVTEVAKADFTFGEPTNLGPTFNTSSLDCGPIILADGLELYLSSWRSGGYGQEDIWVMTRPTTDDEWEEAVNLGPTVNTSAWDGMPSISSDGLSLYFASERPGGYGNNDLWVTRRVTRDDPWGTPANLGPTVNSSSDDWAQSISTDGLTLYFASNRPGGYGNYDLWVTRRATTDDDWGTPVNLGPTVNSSSADHFPNISADGRMLFFGEYPTPRPGGYGGPDIWVTTRATKNDDWSDPVNLGPPVNSSRWDGPSYISADGYTLFFMSERSGGYGGLDMWQVPVIPIVDLNGDGKLDNADMNIMVDHWHTDEPACDIGPTPLGDGIVDAQDMLVLTEYMTKEKVDVEADIAAINELWNQYGIATTSGDLELYVSLWDDSGISMGPDAPPTIGIEQIRASMEGFFAVFNLEGIPIVVEEAEVAGDWAFTRVAFRISVTPKGEPEASPRSGKALSILKRQADGSWKLYIDCWRFDAPPPLE